MQREYFIVREPLLNTQERVLGYELSWRQPSGVTGRLADMDARCLASFIAEQLDEAESGTRLGDYVLFIEVSPSMLSHEAFSSLPSKDVVLALRAADLTTPEAIGAVQDARAEGYGISVRDANLAMLDSMLLPYLTHIELQASASDFAAQVQQFRALNLSSIHLVARGVTTWQAYDLCTSLGMYSFVGNLHLTPRTENHSREMNPAQTLILQLMDMVRKNADVKQLEGVLKRDLALSYKLLRYINSAGFGLGCEVQSIKHAVTMLGYSPLYRWLALLLATATTTGYSPVLMQTAVIRGRFAELLGQTFLPRSEAENLFVAGMFSLLDKLLGVPMEEILGKIQLSEPVMQALLSREGIYGPFLALAEACELNSPELESMAASLCINERQINEAHLAALAWAQKLEL